MFYITGDDSMVMTVHQYDLLSESEEIVFSEDTEEGLFLIGCYNEKLYYVLDQEMGVFCSFDLKHRKNERLAEDVEAGTVIQKGKYFYMHPYNGEDDLVASWLKVYDASTESVHTISNQLCELVSVEFINDEVYYLEYTVNTTYQTLPTTVRVRRCKADGSGQTTLIESLEVSDIIEITENAIRYLDKNEEEKIKSFVPQKILKEYILKINLEMGESSDGNQIIFCGCGECPAIKIRFICPLQKIYIDISVSYNYNIY